MNTTNLPSNLVEDEPKELRQAFGWLNPIFRTLSFLPLMLALFGLLGATALLSQQQFRVSYHGATTNTSVPIWSGKVRHIRFINDDGYFLPDQLSTTDFTLRFRAKLWIPEEGVYTFALDSDDASWLFLNGMQILDNGGRHRMRGKQVSMSLEPGLHDLEVDYRQYDQEAILLLRWSRPGDSQFQLLHSPYIHLPETKSLPLISLTMQKWLSFAGVLLLLVQLWSLTVIVFCFPKARAKMMARLALILILGALGGLQVLWFPALSDRLSESGSLHLKGFATIPLKGVLESLWGSPSAATAAVLLASVIAFVGLQYRLGKDLFASKSIGIAATALLALVAAVLLRGGSVFAGEALVYGTLLLLFGWRLNRYPKFSDHPSDLVLFLLIALIGLWTSWVVLCFLIGVAGFLLPAKHEKRTVTSPSPTTVRALLLLAASALVFIALSIAHNGVHMSGTLPTGLLTLSIPLGLLGVSLIGLKLGWNGKCH